jgi:predicted N-acetyltransferase YhbS
MDKGGFTEISLRPAATDDIEKCGIICFEAFKRLSEKHGVAPSFVSPQLAIDRFAATLKRKGIYCVVAENENGIIGSNFVDERSAIAGVGPLTVDPDVQNKGVGRLLMRHVMDRSAEKQFAGIRLCQATYNVHSFALYAKLGFSTFELLTTLKGNPLEIEIPGYSVRLATDTDLDACNALCRKIHGFDRSIEVLDAIVNETATVVEREGKVTGYATSIAYTGHAVAKKNTDLMALVGAAREILGQGILVPARNSELLLWCVEKGFKIVQHMTLMGKGMYKEPIGPYMPSVIY